MKPIRSFIALAILFLACSRGAADDWHSGQQALVRSRLAAVQKGSTILAWVKWGTRLRVEDAKGEWCKVSAPAEALLASTSASSVTGWINVADLVRPAIVEGINAKKSDRAFTELASILSDSINLNDDKPGKAKTHVEVSAAMRDAISQLEDLEKSADGYIRTLSRQTKEELQLALATARSLDEHPIVRELITKNGTPPELNIGGSLSATGPALTVNYRHVFEAKEIDPEVARLRLKLAGATEQLQAFRYMLANKSRQQSGEARSISGSAILPSFSQMPLSDKLELLNCSGHELNNAVVYVEILKGDEKAVSLHYLPKWPKDAAAYAWYSKGVRLGNKTFANQTLPEVDTVRVSLYCEELSQTDIAYMHNKTERRHGMKVYYEQLGVDIGFSRNPGATEKSNQGYFSIDLKGVPAVGKGTMKLYFFQNDAWEQVAILAKRDDGMYQAAAYQLDTKGKPLEFDGWERGKRKDFYTMVPVWKELNPKKIKVEFEFESNGVSHSVPEFIADLER